MQNNRGGFAPTCYAIPVDIAFCFVYTAYTMAKLTRRKSGEKGGESEGAPATPSEGQAPAAPPEKGALVVPKGLSRRRATEPPRTEPPPAEGPSVEKTPAEPAEEPRAEEEQPPAPETGQAVPDKKEIMRALRNELERDFGPLLDAEKLKCGEFSFEELIAQYRQGDPSLQLSDAERKAVINFWLKSKVPDWEARVVEKKAAEEPPPTPPADKPDEAGAPEVKVVEVEEVRDEDIEVVPVGIPAPGTPEYGRHIEGVVHVISATLDDAQKRELYEKSAKLMFGGDIPRFPDALPPELRAFWPEGALEWARRLNDQAVELTRLGLVRLEAMQQPPAVAVVTAAGAAGEARPLAGPTAEQSARLEAARKKYAEAFKKFEKFDLWWGKLRKGKREELRQAMDAARQEYEQAKATGLAAGPEVADAQKIAARVRNELQERMALTSAKKEQYDKGFVRSFMRGWAWLGEQNLYKFFGRPGEERRGWKAAVGKAILRGANLRTAIGGALAATGWYAPLGVTKLAIFGARGGMMAAGAGIGAFEGMRGAYLESQKRHGDVMASVFASEAEANEKLVSLPEGARKKAREHAVFLDKMRGGADYKTQLESRMSAHEWRAIADGKSFGWESAASYEKLSRAYAELLAQEAGARAHTVETYLSDQHKAVEQSAIAVRGKERKAMAWRRGFAALTGGLFGGAMSWVSYGNSVLTGRLHEGVPMQDLMAERQRRLGVSAETPKPVAAPVEIVPETPLTPEQVAANLSREWGIEANVIAKTRETFGFLEDNQVKALIDASVVKRGNGIESGLLRQLRLLASWKDDPKVMEWFTAHGYDGKAPLEKFAGRLAHRIAMDTGYVTGDGKGRLIGTYWNAKLEAGEKVYRVLGEETRADGTKHWGIVKSENLEKLHVEHEYKTPFYPHKAIAAEVPGAPQATALPEVAPGARPPEELVSVPRAGGLETPVVKGGLPPVPGEQAPVIPHLQIPDDMPSRARVSVEYAWQQYTAEEDAWRRFQALHPDDEYAEQFADAHMDEIRDKKVAFVKEVLQHKVPVRTVVNPARLHATGGWEGFTQRTSEDINWRYSDYLRDLADQKVIAARIADFSATKIPEAGELTSTHPVDVVSTPEGKALAILTKEGEVVKTLIPDGVAIEESAKTGSKWITVFSEDGIVAGELSWNPDTSQMEIAIPEDGGEVDRRTVKDFFEEIAK